MTEDCNTRPLSASIRIRCTPEEKAEFRTITPDMSARLRYLMSRDLKERSRKRSKPLAEKVRE